MSSSPQREFATRCRNAPPIRCWWSSSPLTGNSQSDECFAISEKVEDLCDTSRQLPTDAESSEKARIWREVHRRVLSHGYWARPVEVDCHFESICEFGAFFVRTIKFRPTLESGAMARLARSWSPRNGFLVACSRTWMGSRTDSNSASWPDQRDGLPFRYCSGSAVTILAAASTSACNSGG